MKGFILPVCMLILAGCTTNKPVVSQLPVATIQPSASPYPVSTTKPALSLTDSMKQQLAAKFKKTPADINITISKELENHAKGMVSFAGENGGGLWFAVLEKGGWILTHDGQGPMVCQIAEENAFPKELVPECVSTDGKMKKR